MPAPYDFANILLSGPCNLRCPYCIGRQIDPRFKKDVLDRFPPRNLDRFVALLRRHGVRQVVLTGTNTDPQLYRYEAHLVAWLRAQLPGVQLALHTNGQLALRKMDVFNRYDRVCLSFPSFDPDTYARMTGSRQVPDIERILREARVPVKISCVLDEPNAGGLDAFLARCRGLGVRRVVLRQLYGDSRAWDILPGRAPARTYRHNPVYDLAGLEVTYWRFEDTTSTSLNLFSDGTISPEYLLTRARRPAVGRARPGPRQIAGRFGTGRQEPRAVRAPHAA